MATKLNYTGYLFTDDPMDARGGFFMSLQGDNDSINDLISPDGDGVSANMVDFIVAIATLHKSLKSRCTFEKISAMIANNLVMEIQSKVKLSPLIKIFQSLLTSQISEFEKDTKNSPDELANKLNVDANVSAIYEEVFNNVKMKINEKDKSIKQNDTYWNQYFKNEYSLNDFIDLLIQERNRYKTEQTINSAKKLEKNIMVKFAKEQLKKELINMASNVIKDLKKQVKIPKKININLINDEQFGKIVNEIVKDIFTQYCNRTEIIKQDSHAHTIFKEVFVKWNNLSKDAQDTYAKYYQLHGPQGIVYVDTDNSLFVDIPGSGKTHVVIKKSDFNNYSIGMKPNLRPVDGYIVPEFYDLIPTISQKDSIKAGETLLKVNSYRYSAWTVSGTHKTQSTTASASWKLIGKTPGWQLQLDRKDAMNFLKNLYLGVYLSKTLDSTTLKFKQQGISIRVPATFDAYKKWLKMFKKTEEISVVTFSLGSKFLAKMQKEVERYEKQTGKQKQNRDKGSVWLFDKGEKNTDNLRLTNKSGTLASRFGQPVDKSIGINMSTGWDYLCQLFVLNCVINKKKIYSGNKCFDILRNIIKHKDHFDLRSIHPMLAYYILLNFGFEEKKPDKSGLIYMETANNWSVRMQGEVDVTSYILYFSKLVEFVNNNPDLIIKNRVRSINDVIARKNTKYPKGQFIDPIELRNRQDAIAARVHSRAPLQATSYWQQFMIQAPWFKGQIMAPPMLRNPVVAAALNIRVPYKQALPGPMYGGSPNGSEVLKGIIMGQLSALREKGKELDASDKQKLETKLEKLVNSERQLLEIGENLTDPEKAKQIPNAEEFLNNYGKLVKQYQEREMKLTKVSQKLDELF